MSQISKRLFCVIEAVLYIAYNTGQFPVGGKDIAERQNVPPRYLEQMLQKLVKAKLLRGVRGPRGGYFLAREKRLITLADICAAVEETEELPAHSPLARLVVLPVMQELQVSAENILRRITLADLCEKAEAFHLLKSNEDHHDFII